MPLEAATIDFNQDVEKMSITISYEQLRSVVGSPEPIHVNNLCDIFRSKAQNRSHSGYSDELDVPPSLCAVMF